ncbi:hypothetical protein M758_3G046300 [Ceratodon purpureus]|nr:hypothetical protein M758_3G046300 [Ceratodon purpureus]
MPLPKTPTPQRPTPQCRSFRRSSARARVCFNTKHAGAATPAWSRHTPRRARPRPPWLRNPNPVPAPHFNASKLCFRSTVLSTASLPHDAPPHRGTEAPFHSETVG